MTETNWHVRITINVNGNGNGDLGLVYQAAPRTETPIETAMPMAEKVYGEIATSALPQELECAPIAADIMNVLRTNEWNEMK